MSFNRTRTRFLATAAFVSASMLGLPAAASPTDAISTFVSSVLMAPVANSTGPVSLNTKPTDTSAADHFIDTVLALAPRDPSAAATTTSEADVDSVSRFVERVLIRTSARRADDAAG